MIPERKKARRVACIPNDVAQPAKWRPPQRTALPDESPARLQNRAGNSASARMASALSFPVTEANSPWQSPTFPVQELSSS